MSPTCKRHSITNSENREKPITSRWIHDRAAAAATAIAQLVAPSPELPREPEQEQLLRLEQQQLQQEIAQYLREEFADIAKELMAQLLSEPD